MQVVILAAGRGARLDLLTRDRSKAMLPVLGLPIVERIMLDLAAHGVEEFVVVIGRGDRQIVRHFQDRSELGSRVRLVTQDRPSGMADALACAAPLISGDFVLSACDNLVPRADIGRLIELWDSGSSLDALLAVMPVPPDMTGRSGIVELDGDRVTRIVEKPAPGEAPSNVASLPLYCFSQSFLDFLPGVSVSKRGERELQDAVQAMIERGGRVGGLPVDRRLTLTDPVDLLAINMHYLAASGRGEFPSPEAAGPGTRLVPPVWVGGGTSIGRDCVIGPNVYVEGPCRIGDGATVRDAVVLRGSTVAGGRVVDRQLVLGESVVAELPGR